MPQLDVEGPRPPLTRIVFTRDSIEWGHAATVSDLLTQVPGVYLWRGGYIGRPEPVSFQGRGGCIGGVLPGRGALRAPQVWTASGWIPHCSPSACLTGSRSSAGPASSGCTSSPSDTTAWHRDHGSRIARGDNDYARYEASLERRFQSGLGFGLAGDYLSSPTASGASSDYSNTQVWAQGSYIPSERFGVQYQLVHSRPKRDPYVTVAAGFQDTIGLGYDAKRTDAQVRVMLKGRGTQGLGPRIDLIYARTGWNGEGLKQQINQIGGYLTLPGTELLGHRLRIPSHPLDAAGRAGQSGLEPGRAVQRLGRAGAPATLRRPEQRLRQSLRWFGAGSGAGGHRHRTHRKGGRGASHPHRPEQDVRDYQGALGWNQFPIGLPGGLRSYVALRSAGLSGIPPNRLARLQPHDRMDYRLGPGGAAPVDDSRGLV